jgi:type I restriction enzyme R subunit
VTGFTESVVEQVALAWLERAGWQVRNGAEIAPGEPTAQRGDHGQVVLARRLRESFVPLASFDLRVKDAEKIVGRAV